MIEAIAVAVPAHNEQRLLPADSIVPLHWLRQQLRYASQGWDVVLGTVAVADWDGYPTAFAARYQAW